MNNTTDICNVKVRRRYAFILRQGQCLPIGHYFFRYAQGSFEISTSNYGYGPFNYQFCDIVRMTHWTLIFRYTPWLFGSNLQVCIRFVTLIIKQNTILLSSCRVRRYCALAQCYDQCAMNTCVEQPYTSGIFIKYDQSYMTLIVRNSHDNFHSFGSIPKRRVHLILHLSYVEGPVWSELLNIQSAR